MGVRSTGGTLRQGGSDVRPLQCRSGRESAACSPCRVELLVPGSSCRVLRDRFRPGGSGGAGEVASRRSGRFWSGRFKSGRGGARRVAGQVAGRRSWTGRFSKALQSRRRTLASPVSEAGSDAVARYGHADRRGGRSGRGARPSRSGDFPSRAGTDSQERPNPRLVQPNPPISPSSPMSPISNPRRLGGVRRGSERQDQDEFASSSPSHAYGSFRGIVHKQSPGRSGRGRIEDASRTRQGSRIEETVAMKQWRGSRNEEAARRGGAASDGRADEGLDAGETVEVRRCWRASSGGQAASVERRPKQTEVGGGLKRPEAARMKRSEAEISLSQFEAGDARCP